MKNIINAALVTMMMLGICSISTTHGQTCQWPDETNTGLTNPGALTVVDGNPTITTSGTAADPFIYENKEVTGQLGVNAGYVTIRNCRIWGGWYGVKTEPGAHHVIVEDCDIGRDNRNNYSGILADGSYITIRRNYIHNLEDGVLVFADNIVVQDNYMTEFLEINGSHNDCMQLYGSSNILIKHNNLQMPNQQTACIAAHGDGTVTGLTIESNLLNGGGYTIYTRIAGGTISDVTIVGNHFGRDYVYGLHSSDIAVTSSCNVWLDTGLPVSGSLGTQNNCSQYSCQFDDLTKVAVVTIDPEGGTFTGSASVTLATKTTDAQIRYTTDGSDPTSGSTLYNGSIIISTEGATTLIARGFKAGLDSSAVSSADFTINVDRIAPTITNVTASGDANKVYATFSEAVDQTTAETAGNYAISGLTVSAASLSGNQLIVTLTTTAMSSGQTYTLTVNNVTDLWDNAVAANSQEDFTYQAVDPGLTGWWPFDGSPQDASGNNHTATLNGGTSYGTGKVGQALSLDGTDGHVSLPAAVAGSATDFTFCAWVNIGSADPYLRIFDFNDGTTASQTSGRFMYLTNAYGASAGWSFRIAMSGWGTAQALTAPSPLPANQWVHVAVTLEGNTGKLYRDGAEDATGTISMNPATLNLVDLWLGRSVFTDDPYLTGSQDEVRIYDRALSGAEILALYNSSAGIGYVPFRPGPARDIRIAIRPHPVTTEATLTVTGSKNTTLTGIGVHDLSGNLVKQVPLTGRDGSYRLDLRAADGSLLRAGVYLMTFKLNGEPVTRPIMIMR